VIDWIIRKEDGRYQEKAGRKNASSPIQHSRKEKDPAYSIPDKESLALIEQARKRYPSVQALINLVMHFAFDPENTIPNDYLWRLEPVEHKVPARRQLLGDATRAVKRILRHKSSQTYLIKLKAARGKDCQFIAALLDMEDHIRSSLKGSDPDKIQSLLFEYGLLAQARHEYVKKAHDKGIMDLAPDELK